MIFKLIDDLVGYSGSINNFDQYIVYGSVALVLLLVTIGVDNIFKIFRAILPKGKE